MKKTNYLALPPENKKKAYIPYRIEEGEKFVSLEPNIYSVDTHALGEMRYTLKFTELESKDNLIVFKDSVVNEITKSVNKFFSEETKEGFKELGVCHKTALLLYGAPGTGKTCTAYLSMSLATEKHKAVCVDCTQMGVNSIPWVIETIRSHQDNPIIVLVDEFEGRMAGEERDWLTILDGSRSFENIAFLFCTNYIDKIPDRIRNRKSRIKKCIEIRQLPNEVYLQYIKTKLPTITHEEAAKFAYLAGEKNLVLDQLKNAIIDFKIDKVSIEKAIKEAAKTPHESPVVGENDEEKC